MCSVHSRTPFRWTPCNMAFTLFFIADNTSESKELTAGYLETLGVQQTSPIMKDCYTDKNVSKA